MNRKVALGKGIASLIQETPNQLLAHSLQEEKKGKNISEQSDRPQPIWRGRASLGQRGGHQG